eukprot:4686664-Ditylum_brightwellii.AAC.1
MDWHLLEQDYQGHPIGYQRKNSVLSTTFFSNNTRKQLASFFFNSIVNNKGNINKDVHNN